MHKKLGIMTHACDLGPWWGEKMDRERSDIQGYPRLLFHCCDKNHDQKQCNQEFVLVYRSTGLDIHTVRGGMVVVTGSWESSCQAHNRRQRECIGSGVRLKLFKPSPTDMLPSARFHLPKHYHQLEIKCFNIWSCGGRFSFGPLQLYNKF